MKKLLLFCFVAGIVAACSKDKFQTKPQIKLISQNTEYVPNNGAVSLAFEFTDKEGDLANDSGVPMIRHRLNRRTNSSTRLAGDTQALALPTFPNNNQGEIHLLLNNPTLQQVLNPHLEPGQPFGKEPDSLLLKFVVKDKAGNKSDTATAFVVVERT